MIRVGSIEADSLNKSFIKIVLVDTSGGNPVAVETRYFPQDQKAEAITFAGTDAAELVPFFVYLGW